MADSNGRNVMVQGRILWVVGDLFKGEQRKEYGTNRLLFNEDGTPKMHFGFGLAVPKSALAQTGAGQPGEIWSAIHEEAYTLYPSRNIPPNFAMKYKDGDQAIDDKGVPYAQREGYAGHVVFSCTTSLPIKFFKWENGANILINEGIKCGDYVNVQLNIKAHGAIGAGKPGLYLNPQAVQFLGYGKEIVNTPSGDSIFGTAAPQMPPGASATPIAPMTGMLVPPSTVAPQAPAMPPAAPAPAHYGVLPPQHQPQTPAQAPAMPPMAPQAPAYAPQMPPAAPAGYPPAMPQYAPQAPVAAPAYGAPAMPAYPPQGGMPAPYPQA